MHQNQPNNYPNIITLIGYMGSGKTTLGKQLSKKLNYNWVDLDLFIEEHERMKIPEIFSEFGEAYFREVETKWLNVALQKSKTLISLGGGTPCFNNNMRTITQSSTSIYINLPSKTLVQRLEQGKHKRPLIANFNNAELENFIQSHFSQRLAFYQQADIHFNPLQQDISELVEQLARRAQH